MKEAVIWDRRLECLERSELEVLQLSRLRETVRRVYACVPFYRQSFDAAHVSPDDLCSLADIRRFPFVKKTDLREHFPYGMFAVPMERVVRVHSSSGTTGIPVVVGYTRNDLAVWAELVARVATAAGVLPRDIAHIAFGYGLFTGGFGLHYGLERIGATVLPVSGGNTERQVQIMRHFGSTVLVCTPSYALHIAEVAGGMGVKPAELRLRLGLFGAEPWSERLRREIEEGLGISATDNYGLSEVMGPGVSGECVCKNGMHVNEDHFLVEVIDPESGAAVPEGEVGELVFTSLTKEAFPVVRYRTRDLACLTREPCPCGRTNARMSRVRGRTDDMLIIRGVNVFPSQIESVLLDIQGTEPHYQLIIDRKGALDDLEVWVEASESIFSDEMKEMHRLESTIRKKVETVLGIGVRVKLVEPRTIERSQGKARRVVDRRARD